MAPEDVLDQIAKRVKVLACRQCHRVLAVEAFEPFSIITCPGCQAQQKVPAQLDHFLISERLGRGGMASVYRAFDSTLSRTVAIKVMRRQLSEDPHFVDNFLREARAAAQLNHRNIVQIYSVGRVKDQPFIVMELLDGGRMDDLMAKQKQLPEPMVMAAALDVAEGLAAGADAGIVHGDVKPANILFDRSGTAKVTDFGLAKFQAQASSVKSESGAKGEVWGTPYYIAPEKVRGRKEDQRSDIYSLGATLFHALAGQPPFDAETAQAVVLARLNGPAPGLDTLRTDLSPDTVSIIARMLEADPVRRYPNYRSLIGDLRELKILQGGPTSTGRMSTMDSLKSATGRIEVAHPKPPSMWRMRLAIVAGVVLLLGVGVWLAMRGTGGKTNGPGPASPPPIEVTPGPQTPPPPRMRELSLEIQPFTDEDSGSLKRAAQEYTEGRIGRAQDIWKNLGSNLQAHDVRVSWLSVLSAIPDWVNGQGTEVTNRLSGLAQMNVPPAPGKPLNALALPQRLARVMMGGEYQAVPASGVPPWYGDFSNFIRGYAELASGRLDEGAQLLKRYIDQPVREPFWPYDFQNKARRWVAKTEEWKAFQAGGGGFAARMERGEGKELINSLQKLRDAGGSAPFMDRWYAQALDQARQRHTALETQRNQAAEKARREREQAEQAEVARAGELIMELQRLAVDLKFTEMNALLGEADGRFTTEKGIAAWHSKRPMADLFMRLPGHIQKLAARAPFDARPDGLPGMVVGADYAKMSFQDPGSGRKGSVPWARLKPQQFIVVASYYVKGAVMPEPERGGLYLALAWYAQGMPQIKISRFVELALAADPSLRPLAAETLPGVALP